MRVAVEEPFRFPPEPLDPLLVLLGAAEGRITGLLRRLLQGRPLITRQDLSGPAGPPATALPPGPTVIYLAALPWSYRFQRPQRLALALARLGHPVLYVEGFSRVRLQPSRRLLRSSGGVEVVRVALPGRPDLYRRLPSREAAAAVARALLAGIHRPTLAVLAQLPAWGETAAHLAEGLTAPLLYDCIDLHTAFPGVPPEVGSAEEDLLRRAHLVTATSSDLAERSRAGGAWVHLLPNAVDPADFPDPAPLPSPRRAGYVGAVDGRFDAGALEAAARALPGWEIAVAGTVEERATADRLARLPGVKLLGEIPRGRVPGFLRGLGVGLVPFVDSSQTRAVDSVKIYEMLASGLPVVARRLPETGRWPEPLVYLYDDPARLPELLERALQEDSPALRLRRREAVAAHTWDRRAADLLELLAGAPGREQSLSPAPMRLREAP